LIVSRTKWSSYLFVAVASVLAAASVAQASLTVVNFDNLEGAGAATPPPTGYGGIKWESTDWGLLKTGPNHGIYPSHSGNMVIANLPLRGYAESKFSFATPVPFDGAWISGVSTGNVWKLYLNNTLVFTSAPQDAVQGVSKYFPTGYSGLVNRVGIYSNHGYIVMDDFTYGVRDTPVVPEPASLVTVGLGGLIAGLASWRRTRRRAEARE
jgi:hypothetical protein